MTIACDVIPNRSAGPVRNLLFARVSGRGAGRKKRSHAQVVS